MIDILRNKIISANEAYRLGKPILSDKNYDTLIEELRLISPDDELLNKVGHQISDDRKTRLPIVMASMNKIKTMDDIDSWTRTKSISKNEMVIITPKFDGLSLCVNEGTGLAITRGDGIFGQNSTEHYKLIKNKLTSKGDFTWTYGEVMMSKKTFTEKYSEFANPRNLVAGLINSKEINPSLKDCFYIKYGIHTDSKKFKTKKEILDVLNASQDVKVQYFTCKISELKEEKLIELFHKWSSDFEIDGVIIEINKISIQESLGRETSSNNPVWARAFKHSSFEQNAETKVIGITWNISKQGFLKPVLQVKPVNLDGVTVSNVTGNNARFVKDFGLGVGSIIKIVRSGMVIPKIIDVVKTVDFVYPEVFDNNGQKVKYSWNDGEVEFVTDIETEDQKIKKIISFFETLEAKNVSTGVITQIWNHGYRTIKEILSLKKEDFEKIEGFGKRKSEIVFSSIQKSINDVSLSKLQHASGIFNGLGSKKLALLEHFKTKPSIEDVLKIDGFAEISAKTYINGYDKFLLFIKDLPITFKSEDVEVVSTGDKFMGKTFVFTGVRLPEFEKIIVENGGKIGSSVSKNTTYLVMKSIGSGSSKEKKAIELGVKLLSVNDLEKMINN